MKEYSGVAGAAVEPPAGEKFTNVVSLDFDDCLFFKGKVEVDGKSESRKQVLAFLFGKLLKNLAAEMVFDGSSRQHKWTELLNISRMGGASFGRFDRFMKAYNESRQAAGQDEVVFVKALMEDLWYSLAPGTTFGSAAQWEKANEIEERLDVGEEFDKAQDTIDVEMGGRYASVPSFKGKIAMVYWQMCLAKERYPEGKVVFHFCDNSKNILGSLEKFYQECPELIPAGMVLQLHHTGDVQKIQAEIAKDETINLLHGCDTYDPIISTNSGNSIHPVDHQIYIRTALKYACTFTEGPDHATLDGHEARFGEAMIALITPMATEGNPLCAVVQEYEVMRAKEGQVESHYTKGQTHSYGEKKGACAAFKLYAGLQTKESSKFLAEFIDTLSAGRLGGRFAKQLQESKYQGRKRPLFAPPNKKVISDWLAKESDSLPQKSAVTAAEPDAATAGTTGGGGGGAKPGL